MSIETVIKKFDYVRCIKCNRSGYVKEDSGNTVPLSKDPPRFYVSNMSGSHRLSELEIVKAFDSVVTKELIESLAHDDCACLLAELLLSRLSIAEIAAQRGMEPRDVFVEEIEKYGFVQTDGMESRYYNMGNRLKARVNNNTGNIVHESYYDTDVFETIFFQLPYTAITPALIKAVCGGGE